MPAHPAATIDLRTLRRLWKPRRDTYADALLYEECRIRIHRSFTWLERAVQYPDANLDDRLLAQWAGVMALAARWDAHRSAPMRQAQVLVLFTKQLAAHDRDGLLEQVLHRERALVQGIFDDRYLARFFPTPVDLEGLYARARWERVLNLALQRVALVHAQLAQGGASYGSRENRTALKRAIMLLDRLAMVFIQIVTEYGYTDEWGDLCWPPRRAEPGPNRASIASATRSRARSRSVRGSVKRSGT